MLVIQESGLQKSNAGSSSAMSPIRKAMSLSTLFRQSVDGKSNSQSQMKSSNGTSPRLGGSNMNGTTSSTISGPQIKRMTRRISFRRSPSLSPANNISLPNPTVSPNSFTGTPSSITSSTPGATPASFSSSTGSTFANSSSSNSVNASATFRGRPRSGSCRATFNNGNGRILPFTLPAMGGSTAEEENESMETPKGKRASIYGFRARSTSFSPSSPPRRPITPAPLLNLDDEMNSLGITTGPMSTWLTNSSSHGPADSFDRPSGLGLSAPFSVSMTDPLKSGSFGPSAMHRLSLCPSQESFHCRGLETSFINMTDRGLDTPPFIGNSTNPVPPPMIRSVSETTTTTEATAVRTNKNITPGSPLGWRRRPWALSLQLQPSSQVPKSVSSPTGFTPPHTAVPTVTVTSNKGEDDLPSLQLPSRFSISSEDTGKTSDDRNSSCQQSTENEIEVEEENGYNLMASPNSVWSSSVYSFDTTNESPPMRDSSQLRRLESPPVRQSSRLNGEQKTDSADFVATVRRRSKTVSVIPDKRVSSLEIGSLRSISKMQIPIAAAAALAEVESKMTEDIPAICPASPPPRVRLHLTLPPSTVSKGLPQAHTMLMPTTASTLEFKETICKSLQFRHGLSISPSQLGLFVAEEQDAKSGSLSPLLTPNLSLHSGSSVGTTSPFNRSPNLPSLPSSNPSICSAKTGGFLRSRLRSSSNGGLTSPPIGSTPSNNPITQQHKQHLSPSIRPQAYRQLQNESALYQEGLQDDDAIIVRF